MTSPRSKCGSPQRLGGKRFADHYGNVFDFSKVNYVEGTEFRLEGLPKPFKGLESVFEITPEMVGDWDPRSSYLRSTMYAAVSYPFNTWYDEKFNTCLGKPEAVDCPLREQTYIRLGKERATYHRHLEENWTDPREASKQPSSHKKWMRSFGMSFRKKHIVKRPPVTLLTILFVWMHICGDLDGMLHLFFPSADLISRDIRSAGLGPLLPRSFFWTVLGQLQITTYKKGVLSGPRSFRPITHLLISKVFDSTSADITPEGIQRKLDLLFQTLPRLYREDLRFYAVRCGLVYGSLAAYESKARDRRTFKYEIAAAAVTGATSTLANIPTVSGVPVGKMIEPVATSVRGTLNYFFRRRQRHHGTGVGNVEHKFLVGVIGEANEGLLASYPPGQIPRDENRTPRPAFTPVQLAQYKQTAWQVFQFVMNEENCHINFQLSEHQLGVPSNLPSAPTNPPQANAFYPSISSDSKSSTDLPVSASRWKYLVHVWPAADAVHANSVAQAPSASRPLAIDAAHEVPHNGRDNADSSTAVTVTVQEELESRLTPRHLT